MKQLLIIFLVTVVVYSCKKEPQLSIDKDRVYFTNNDISETIRISNAGDIELEWNISTDILWLEQDYLSGKVSGKSNTTITLNAIKYMEPGVYSSSIVLTSNGGDRNINAEMDLDFKPGIFHGVGLENININDSYDVVTNKYGSPDKIRKTFIEELLIYEHIVEYFSSGLGFYFYTEDDKLNIWDPIVAIGILDPFNEVTTHNIGITTPMKYVEYCYDKPDDILSYNDIDVYIYPSLGIDFGIYQTKVGIIWIYSPYEYRKVKQIWNHGSVSPKSLLR